MTPITSLDFVAIPSQDAERRASSTARRWGCAPTTRRSSSLGRPDLPRHLGARQDRAARSPRRRTRTWRCTSTTWPRRARNWRPRASSSSATRSTPACATWRSSPTDGNDLMLHCAILAAARDAWRAAPTRDTATRLRARLRWHRPSGGTARSVPRATTSPRRARRRQQVGGRSAARELVHRALRGSFAATSEPSAAMPSTMPTLRPLDDDRGRHAGLLLGMLATATWRAARSARRSRCRAAGSSRGTPRSARRRAGARERPSRRPSSGSTRPARRAARASPRAGPRSARRPAWGGPPAASAGPPRAPSSRGRAPGTACSRR